MNKKKILIPVFLVLVSLGIILRAAYNTYYSDILNHISNSIDTYEQQGHYRLAEKLYLARIFLVEKAKEKDTKLIYKYKADLSRFYGGQGLYEKAANVRIDILKAKGILKNNNIDASCITRDDFYDLYSLGISSFYNKKYDKAEYYYNLVEKAEVTIPLPKDIISVLYFNRDRNEMARIAKFKGIIRLEENRYKEAESFLDKAAELNTEKIEERLIGGGETDENYFVRAILYTKVKKYKQAEQYAQKLVKDYQDVLIKFKNEKIKPIVSIELEKGPLLDYYTLLAYVYQSEGKFKEAEATLKKAIVISNEAFPDTHPERACGYYHLMKLYEQTGDKQEMNKLKDKVFDVSKESLAFHHIKRKDIDNTLKSYCAIERKGI